MSRSTGEGNVLLAVREDRVEPAALCYALNICKRLGTDMDLLLVPHRNVVPARVAAFLEELTAEGIHYRLVRRSAPLGEAIAAYVREHKEVLFVVIDSLESWGGTGVSSRRAPHPWNQLRCPVVVAAGE